jgi:uncharacterized protein YecE (DUF72 family)
MAEVRVGVSGWRYPRWRGDFYPPGLVQRRELEYVASRMNSAEINGSFYSLQRPTTYQRFVDETPDDFLFAVKGGRFITHMRRLVNVDTALANFLASGVLGLGHKLGPMLWQLPPSLEYDERLVAGFLELLPRTTEQAAQLARAHDDKVKPGQALVDAPLDVPLRHCMEVRHRSFCGGGAIALLEEYDVALVVADSPGRWPYLERTTTDFMYARLHGHSELYASGYSAASLDAWADKVRAWTAEGLDVFVYFDNDSRGRAPHDAVALLARLS